MPNIPVLTDTELLRHVDAQYPCDPLVAELARRLMESPGPDERLDVLDDYGINTAELARRFADSVGVTSDQHEMLELLADYGIGDKDDLESHLQASARNYGRRA